ncbi:MAG: DUF3990 domain-containing protein [Fibrobacteraceae bacterium]|mgnify:CR=1 FL=1|nr:DUF3990 domain-containing protein [Fibrobacteraceae bacterium]MCF0217300.1 DUF3990 domain-containing protein [Fibrobacteraceae bacterium]
MILYHGSNTDIVRIDLSKCRPNKDFGKGFYLTTIQEQAERMAQRVARMYGGKPILNIYDFNDSPDEMKKLNVRCFKGPCVEWAKFVIANRNATRIGNLKEDSNVDGRFDLVIGPIANDDLALLFRQFSEGSISVTTLVNEMKFKKLTDQYSFHTEKALATLIKKEGFHV